MYTVVTHDGKFHSDEIFGVAVLQLRFGEENLKIVRTRQMELIQKADIVLDVGGEYDPEYLRFDHHQNGAPVREQGIPYAAFGLVWKEFGEAITGSKEIADKIDERLAQPIDAGDNGVTLYSLNEHKVAPVELSSILESFMPPMGSDRNQDEAFMEAVIVARNYLVRVIELRVVKQALKEEAKRVYKESEKKTVLVFETPMKRDVLQDYAEVKVIVTPSDAERTKWSALVVPVEGEAFISRAYFPEAWAGLRDEELALVSGIQGAIFCHKGRFIFVAKSQEGAVAAAKQAR